jgi:hypothetical protein
MPVYKIDIEGQKTRREAGRLQKRIGNVFENIFQLLGPLGPKQRERSNLTSNLGP